MERPALLKEHSTYPSVGKLTLEHRRNTCLIHKYHRLKKAKRKKRPKKPTTVSLKKTTQFFELRSCSVPRGLSYAFGEYSSLSVTPGYAENHKCTVVKGNTFSKIYSNRIEDLFLRSSNRKILTNTTVKKLNLVFSSKLDKSQSLNVLNVSKGSNCCLLQSVSFSIWTLGPISEKEGVYTSSML